MTIENEAAAAIIHDVFAVTATTTPNVFVVDADLTDIEGNRYRANYVSQPDDTFGLAPVVRAWLDEHAGSYEIHPYTPPSIEEIREGMTPLSARQLRLGLIRAGISLRTVEAALAALPEGSVREEAQIEWGYASEYRRLAPALLSIAGALSLSPERVDELFRASAEI